MAMMDSSLGGGIASPQMGIPQGVVPTSAPDEAAMSEIVQLLKGGQVGAERMLQLLSLLAMQTVPQLQQQQQQQPQEAQTQGIMGAMMGGAR